VTFKHRYDDSSSQIDVQFKRRYDLIPNLVETAKAYLKHESETIIAVAKARNEAMNSLNVVASNPSSAAAMSRFNITVETYPDLNANTIMMPLTAKLTSTEDKVTFAHQAFNDAVTTYNIYHPSSLLIN
jgi:LemA protein